MSDWMLDTLIATSALMALVLLIREPVRRYFGSRVTYGLWLIPAARLLMPTLTTTVERTVPRGGTLQPLFQPTVGEPLLLSNVAMNEPSLLVRLGGWPTLLLTLWLGVAAALFLSRMVAFRRDRRAILDAGTEVDRFGSVRIVSSPEVASPVAFGVFDRVIAIPGDFDRNYDDRERRLALDHELAHHRSGDLIANLFAFVLLCLQWFNPLAWVAHAAFRFDQEAACDARVLDKASASVRADYGRAIAKAASGRALLFASALDRRNRLHRRLQSMLRNPDPSRHLAGRLIVAAAIAIALPLTASRAIAYVDVPAPEAKVPAVAAPPAPVAAPAPVSTPAALPAPAAIPVRPAAPVLAAAALAPPAAQRENESITIRDEMITIDGRTKRWEQLTPAEKARVREGVAKARAGLAKAHLGRDRALREVGDAMAKVRLHRDELGRLAETNARIAETMRRLDDPRIRAALESARAIDVAAIQRSIAAIDEQKIAASLAKADEAMRSAEAELDRLEVRMRTDPR
jgi:beta-lactamase regulating signal transducer with metallopeptidase domain